MSHSPWHNNQQKTGLLGCMVHKYWDQAKSRAVYLSGGCQANSLVIKGRLDFWYLWVLQVTGLREAVGFHLVLVLVTSLLQNQLLYFSLAIAFLLKLVICSNLLDLRLFIFASFNE